MLLVILSFIVTTLDAKESPSFVIQSTISDNLKPTLSQIPILDENELLTVEKSEEDSEFLVFLASSRKRFNPRLFISTDGGQTVKEKSFRYHRQIVFIDRIVPAAHLFFCLCRSLSITFYINKSSEMIEIHPINNASTFEVNGRYPDSIIQMSKMSSEDRFHVSLSRDFGATYKPLIPDCHRSQWVQSGTMLLMLYRNHSSSNDLLVGLADLKSLSLVRFGKSGIKKIFESNGLTFLVFDNAGLISIHLFGNESSILKDCELPTNLIIKDVIQIVYQFKAIYIAIKNGDWDRCLYYSDDKSLKFTKITCHLYQRLASFCPFTVKAPGIILGNLYDAKIQKFTAHVSLNNGKNWVKPNIHGFEGNYADIQLLLDFPCDHISYSFNAEWIGTFRGKLYLDGKYKFTSFVTFDFGLTLKYAPDSDYHLTVLAQSGTLVGFAHSMKSASISYDSGDTWLVDQIFAEEKALVKVISRQEYHPNSLFFVTADKILATLSFEKINNKTCSEKDFVNREIPRFRGSCYQGKVHECKIMKPNSFCTSSNSPLPCFPSRSCHCTLSDFPCRFGFEETDGLCEPDPDSGIVLPDLTCKENKRKVSHLIGYEQPNYNCEIPDFEFNIDQNHSDFCGINEHESFIVLFNKKSFSLMYVTHSGSLYDRTLFKEYIQRWETPEQPFSFDFGTDDLYASRNTLIYRIPAFHSSKFSKTELFYHSTKVVLLEFDSLTHNIFLLDDLQDLYSVDVNTLFKLHFASGATAFQLKSHERMLTFVANKKTCFYDLISRPQCHVHRFEIIHAVYDFVAWFLYLLTTTHRLLIYKIKPSGSIYNILTISNVSWFDISQKNIFYVEKQTLFVYDIDKRGKLQFSYDLPSQFGPAFHSYHIKFHAGTSRVFADVCKNLKCSFMCQSTLLGEEHCICPADSKLVGNKCTCSNNSSCYERHSVGFLCRNRISKKNNVRCNSADDCGDYTDESSCPRYCKRDEHLCGNYCWPKDRICPLNLRSQLHHRHVIVKKKSRSHLIGSLLFAIVLLFAGAVSDISKADILARISSNVKNVFLRKSAINIAGFFDTQERTLLSDLE